MFNITLFLKKVSLVKVFTWVQALVSPPFCAYCHAFMDKRTPLCDACILNIKPVLPHYVTVTKMQRIPVYALSDYQEPLRTFILSKNYGDKVMIEELARIMVDRLPLHALDFDIIVPIPLHWRRKAWRGFNQAEVIAQMIGHETDKPVVTFLRRKKKTVFQAELRAHDRASNLVDAFELTSDALKYKNMSILLVDDLLTTGSTVRSAAKLLKGLNPRKLHAIVACRVIT